jgi:hypothetical protein
LGAVRLQLLQQSGRVLLHCDGCGNRDHYEAETVRDALLIPGAAPKGAPLPLTLTSPPTGSLPLSDRIRRP